MAYRLNFKVPDVLLPAPGATLCKAVTVELCQLGAWNARSEMQAVHVLADHICNLAGPLQAHQRLSEQPVQTHQGYDTIISGPVLDTMRYSEADLMCQGWSRCSKGDLCFWKGLASPLHGPYTLWTPAPQCLRTLAVYETIVGAPKEIALLCRALG